MRYICFLVSLTSCLYMSSRNTCLSYYTAKDVVLTFWGRTEVSSYLSTCTINGTKNILYKYVWRPTGRVLKTLKERKFTDSCCSVVLIPPGRSWCCVFWFAAVVVCLFSFLHFRNTTSYTEFIWHLHTCSFSALLPKIVFLLTFTSIDFKNYVCQVVPFGVMSHQDFYLFVVQNTLYLSVMTFQPDMNGPLN